MDVKLGLWHAGEEAWEEVVGIEKEDKSSLWKFHSQGDS
jgi:hypothetical protein